jgi:lipopolysaccharide/colanic/teichoic acid biosynthesis glycosyltransferase
MDPFHSTPRIEVEHDLPFMTYELAPKPAELMAIKGLMDLAISLAAVVILAPLLATVALLIRVSMGRPVFFVQDRIGLNGRLIRVMKFRTMVPGAELRRDELLEANEMDGPVFKIADDPRVTRLGRTLRRTSVDELPQLFNVLLGQMSLVGPRPLPVKEQREIRGLYRRRLSMKPGITGLWQVSGRNELAFEEWMKLDRKYVEEWSLLLDLKILFRTVVVVLSGRGAR